MKRFLALAAMGVAGCQVIWGIDPDVTVCDPSKLDHDANNCGACGHRCGGGSCASGSCQPVVIAQASGTPTDLAVDAKFVFWTSDDGSLGRVEKNGHDQRALLSGISGGLGRIALDERHVYVRDSGGTYTIHSLAKDGSGLGSVATDQPGEGGLASDGASLYWTRTEGSNIGKLMRASFDANGTPTLTALLENRSFPQEIAGDGSSIFWSENLQDLMQLGIGGGGTPLELACKPNIEGVALNDASVYFSTDGGEITRTPKNEADVNCVAPNARVLAQNPGAPAFGIAVAGTRVVWSSPDAGEIWVAPKTGSCAAPPCAQRLAGSQNKPGRVAADAEAAYWVNQGDHTIAKVVF